MTLLYHFKFLKIKTSYFRFGFVAAESDQKPISLFKNIELSGNC